MLALTDTINLVEVVWTIITGATLILNMRAAWSAWDDSTELRKRRINGVRQIIARSNLRTELGRVYRSLLSTVVGVVFMAIPNLVPGGLVSTIAALIFVSFAGADLIGSILDRRDREDVLAVEEDRVLRERGAARRIEELSEELQTARPPDAGPGES